MKVSEIFWENNIGNDNREEHMWGNHKNRSWGLWFRDISEVSVTSHDSLANESLSHDSDGLSVTEVTIYSDDNNLQLGFECLVR